MRRRAPTRPPRTTAWWWPTAPGCVRRRTPGCRARPSTTTRCSRSPRTRPGSRTTRTTGPWPWPPRPTTSPGGCTSLLPAIYRRFDAARLPAPDSGLEGADLERGALRRFLDLPGSQLDQLYSLARAALGLLDLDRVDGRLLPLIGQWIGWPTDLRLPVDAQRNELPLRARAVPDRRDGPDPGGHRRPGRRLGGPDQGIRAQRGPQQPARAAQPLVGGAGRGRAWGPSRWCRSTSPTTGGRRSWARPTAPACSSTTPTGATAGTSGPSGLPAASGGRANPWWTDRGSTSTRPRPARATGCGCSGRATTGPAGGRAPLAGPVPRPHP